MQAQQLPTTPPVHLGDGVRAAAPIVLGYLPIGFAFGVLAHTAGLSVAEVFLMSLLVYAGSAQFIGVGMLQGAAAAPAIIGTTFLVNLRHLLMSTALAPAFRENQAWQNSLLAHGITDESFALHSALLQGRPARPGYAAGLHFTAQAGWIVASVAGALVGNLAANTAALGLDFALPAMFVGLLLPNLQGAERKPRLWAALIAGAVSVVVCVAFPDPSWAVILATLAAATVGVMLPC